MITPPRTNPLDETLIEDFEPSQEPVKAHTYGNATTKGSYTPPIWIVRAGAGEKSPNGRAQG